MSIPPTSSLFGNEHSFKQPGVVFQMRSFGASSVLWPRLNGGVGVGKGSSHHH